MKYVEGCVYPFIRTTWLVRGINGNPYISKERVGNVIENFDIMFAVCRHTTETILHGLPEYAGFPVDAATFTADIFSSAFQVFVCEGATIKNSLCEAMDVAEYLNILCHGQMYTGSIEVNQRINGHIESIVDHFNAVTGPDGNKLVYDSGKWVYEPEYSVTEGKSHG